MAKAKLSFLRDVADALGVRSYITIRKQHSDLSFSERNCVPLLTKKPRPKRVSSPKQRAQRLKFCDCDKYYRSFTLGQRGKWFHYYFYSRRHKWTLSKTKQRKRLGKVGERSIHLSAYAYFMKRCLNWDLKHFLEDYLGAMWKVDKVERTEQGFRVEARVTKAVWEELAEIYSDPLSRLVVRG